MSLQLLRSGVGVVQLEKFDMEVVKTATWESYLKKKEKNNFKLLKIDQMLTKNKIASIYLYS